MQCQSSDLVGQLVFDYLCHYGHWETAAAVGRDVLGGAVEVRFCCTRQQTKQAVRVVALHRVTVGALLREISAFAR